MNKTSRRGLRLASALVAAGFVLSAAPAVAVADDGNGVLSLTDSQAEELSQRLQLDPYGDTAATDDTASGTEDTPATEWGSTDSGTADSGTSDSSTADAGTTALPAPKVTATGFTEGATGMAATTPVAGTNGDYFTVHAGGNISRRSADGKETWTRDNNSLYKDWDVPVLSPRYLKEPYPARVIMGFNAVTPFSPVSDQGYDTGDLTGDGVPDLVFTADVGTYPYRPFTHGDSTLHTGTFVTVLDGASGKTLWTKLYAGAYQIKLVGKTLLVANTPYYNTSASSSSTSTLTGIRFDHADGKLTEASSWTYDTGLFTGAAWSSLEDLGGGLIAASWNKRKTSLADTTASHTLVLDSADGSVKWQSTNTLYSRQLHLDASRKRIVTLEMPDVNDAVGYEIASYDLGDGKRTTLAKRTNVFAMDLEVGDIQGDKKPEYSVSEDTLDEYMKVNANTVRALNGDDASVLWQRTVKRDADNTRDGATAWNLAAVDGTLVASYKDDQDFNHAVNSQGGRFARLAVLKGSDGSVKWEKRGMVASQAWAQPFPKDDGWRLRTVDTDQNIHVYNLNSGKQDALTPIQSQLWSAVLMDVNGDGKKDIVAGGQSQGLYAFDGPSMTAGRTKLLWKTTVPGQIHKIVKADLDGTGTDELVVAADNATAVVDATTGKVRTTIDGQGQFVWSLAAGDLDHDGKDEIVVPTDKIRAYDDTGRQKWAYTAPAANTVFGDISVVGGQVYGQYGSRDAFYSADPNAPAPGGRPTGAVAVNGANGATVWEDAAPKPQGTATLYGTAMRGAAFASKEIPYADGHAVAETWLIRNTNGNMSAVVEIRDGRTGEVLHSAQTGGPWTQGNWFTGPEGLYLVGTNRITLFGPDGKDYAASASGTVQTGGFLTGPNGVRYLIGAGATGFDLLDPAGVKSGSLSRIAYGNVYGGREYVSGDLNGDGTDEVVSLNFDDTGIYRMSELEEGGYFVPYTAVRQLTVFTLS
ncbi:FG-GAP-like repeat-containing protein [Streptomyces sp. VRA16 Mangrove soil]|uniref:FG-GAP-like repeat-containing protein n=1 Tax=Streptomyces sp. VRA16 Mangrove soil TaxID=2817434 RepID=UPI001A9F30A1|nr:FG-GAP-like repeat-containing protein [Streptomyces sp. VRA16 Mangrove soil]MBO1331927.1 VCBS repeat-containing protein [Streptomyces sp. VRA16 Mangrove soil]